MSVEQVAAKLTPVSPRRKHSQRGLLTWAGLQAERDQLRALATIYRDADLALDAVSRNPLDDTVRALKQPDAPNLLEARRAALAQEELVQYHKHLVQNLGVDYHLARREWATILNPHPLELAQCDRNLED